ncbi:MAG: hypothetical protein KDJ65_24210 [Anaerolineae bacterium]|nr:hypothetical protein [Anaerolineae bacterium]
MTETVSPIKHAGNLNATSILSTKLFIPQARPSQEVLSRSHLIDRLQSGLSRRLTLISAPAGFGKTTFLAQWIPHSDRGVCWVSLDEADNDLSRFLAYVIAALQMLKADFGQAVLLALQSSQPPSVENLVTALVNEIAQMPELVLVLDDYHLIHLPAIHAAIAFLVNNLPPAMHLILASRADPPLPLARLRARGHLTEFRSADLRFTPDEAAAFLKEVMGLHLSAEDIAALETRTEGWIAGLQLAALSMQGRDDLSGFIQAFTGSHMYIVDYLAEEVLQRQPDRIQTFLLQTALLERLSGPLCDAVTGGNDSQAILEKLQQNNLFIVPLDDERRWYRYHHLFAQVLRTRLEQSHPDSVPDIHHRASAWYEQQNLLEEAMQHAVAAGAFEQVARLIEQLWTSVFATDPLQPLFTKWLASLPAEFVRVRPKLCLIQAWVLLQQRNLEGALRCLEEAEQALTQQNSPNTDETRNIRGEIMATRVLIAALRNPFEADQIKRWSQEALANLRSDNAPYRGVVFGALGNAAMHQQDVRRAEQAFAEAAANSRAAGTMYVTLVALINQTNIQRARGALGLAIATCQQALAWVAEQDTLHSAASSGLYLNLADLLRERNDLETALHYATIAVTDLAQGFNHNLIALSLLTLARIKQAQSQWDDAFALVKQVRQVAEEQALTWVLTLLPAFETHLRLAQGDLLAALSWFPSLDWAETLRRQYPGSYTFVYGYEYGQIIQAQMMLAQGRSTADPTRLREVVSRCEQHSQAAQAAGLLWLQMKADALQALAYQALGNLPSALTCLERALTPARLEGYVRLFVDEGEPMAQLLSQAAKTGLMPGYIGQLLAAFPDLQVTIDAAPTKAPSIDNYRPKIQNLIEPLSERELEVLALIAEGLTNQEIAQHIFVSPLTVKVHARNIYGKLGVKNRTQAVTKARELGLLV